MMGAGACTVVEGRISPMGYCDLYAPRGTEALRLTSRKDQASHRSIYPRLPKMALFGLGAMFELSP